MKTINETINFQFSNNFKISSMTRPSSKPAAAGLEL